VLVAAVSVFAMASVAAAGLKSNGDGIGGGDVKLKSYVPDTLLSSIQQDPKQTFDVIVQSNDRGERSRGFIQLVARAERRRRA
jgi:hypothetical protein